MLEFRGIDLDRFIFIDHGCGKGRLLLLAADLPFKRVIGVELSESLCVIAQNNAAAYKRGIHSRRIEVWRGASQEAVFPNEPTIHVFYNPFDEDLMRQTLVGLSSLGAKTETFVVYVNPQHRQILPSFGFHMISSGRRNGEEWSVWQKQIDVVADHDRVLVEDRNRL